MFKKGFTLAEVLITLSIIGVVSALTIPALIQDAADADIEPKLKKTQTALAQANKTLLYKQGVDRITETPFAEQGSGIDTDAYMQELSNYLKTAGTYILEETSSGDVVFESEGLKFYILSDGVSVAFVSPTFTNGIDTLEKPHKTHVGFYLVDVNGQTKPNSRSKDIFEFKAFDDGSARQKKF